MGQSKPPVCLRAYQSIEPSLIALILYLMAIDGVIDAEQVFCLYFIVGIVNSAPSFTPLGQREVIVLVLL